MKLQFASYFTARTCMKIENQASYVYFTAVIAKRTLEGGSS